MDFQKNSAFFFDLDNTLFNYEASFKQASLFAFDSIFSPLLHKHISPETWFKSYKIYCDLYWPAYEAQVMTRKQYQRNRLVSSLLSLNFQMFDDGLIHQYQMLCEEKIPSFAEPFPWTKEMIDRIYQSGHVAGVITNGSSSLQRKKLSILGLNFLDKDIYISAEINLSKPSPDIFTFVKNRCSAKQFFYIGDSYDFDMLPAVRAGWTGIWWNPEQQLLPQEEEKIHNCCSVTELNDAIKRYIE